MTRPTRWASILVTAALVASCSGDGSVPGSSTTAGTAITTTSTVPPQQVTTSSAVTSTTLPASEFEQVAVVHTTSDAMRGGLERALFSPDGATILTVTNGAEGAAVVSWDAGNGQQVVSFEAESNGVNDARFNADGTRIVTAHQEGTARVWDAATGAVIATLALPARYPPLWTALFSPDGATVATVDGIDAKVTLWDVATEQPRLELTGLTVAFSPDGSRVATAGVDPSLEVVGSDLASMLVQVWDSSTGESLGTLTPEPPQYLTSAVYGPDGSKILAIGIGLDPQTSLADVWDAQTGRRLPAIDVPLDLELPAASFSDDGATILTTHLDGVRIWDATTGETLAGPFGASQPTRVDRSPDGATVLTGDGLGEVALWDVASGERQVTLSPPAVTGIAAVDISPNGDGVAAASYDGTLRIWRAASAPPVSAPPTTSPPSTSSTSTTSTAPATPDTTPIDETALLRGDGLGPHRFGDPAADVEAWLVAELGPISGWDTVHEPLTSEAQYPARKGLRWISWWWGLDVAFSDIGPNGPTPDGSLQFIAWRYQPFGAGMNAGLPPADWSLLDTPGGVSVAMPLADLRARYTTFAMDADGSCPTLGLNPAVLDPYQPIWYGGDDEFDLGATGTAEAGLRGHPAPSLPGYVGRLEAGARRSCRPTEARTPPAEPVDDRVVLAPNALGPYRIGRSADRLVAWLEATLGPPQQDAALRRPGPAGGAQEPIGFTGYVYNTAYRSLQWYDLGLTVVLSDIVDPALGAEDAGVLRFAGWIAGPRLQTRGGTRVGATVGTLLDEFGDVTFGQWQESMYGNMFTPTAFIGPWLRGSVAEWNVVRAVQERLVANGAELEISGVADGPTRAALIAFNRAHGLEVDLAPFVLAADGTVSGTGVDLPLNEAVAAALGLVPPLDTLIIDLRS